MSEMGENLYSKNSNWRNTHYLYGFLTGATKNEPEVQENTKLRNHKWGILLLLVFT